jgi:protein phosphatase 2C family protein 2/3
MVVEAEVVSVPVLDAQYFAAKGNSPTAAAVHEIEDVVTVSPSPRRLSQVRISDSVPADQLVSFLHDRPLFLLGFVLLENPEYYQVKI